MVRGQLEEVCFNCEAMRMQVLLEPGGDAAQECDRYGSEESIAREREAASSDNETKV